MTREQPPPPVYAPVRTLMLYLTEACPLRCTYCFVEKKPRSMSLETAQRAVDFFLSRDVSGAEGVLQVNFFGGEPFLEYERMEEVVDYCLQPRRNTGKRFTFSATTGGAVFNERIAALLRRADMSLLFSLDGGPEVTAQDRPFASGRSSYDVVARNLRAMADAAHDLVARTTFHSGALDLVGRVEAVFAAGAPAIALCPVLECDWAAAEEPIHRAYDALAEWYLAHATSEGVPQLVITNRLLAAWHAHLRGAPRPLRPCSVGHSLLGIDPDGNVMPCHRFLYRPQDWLTTVDRPADLARRRHPYLALDSRKMPDCGACAAEPVCGGGCRIVALNQGLDLQDPYLGHCIPMRAHQRAVERIYHTLRQRGTLSAALVGRPATSGALSELISVG